MELGALVKLNAWASIVEVAAARNRDDSKLHFHSRPDIDAPKLSITLRNDELLSPGYIFTSPGEAKYQVGPYIYDDAGDLIWGGVGDGINVAHGFHVCDYMGDTGAHLCFFEGHKRGGYARGYDTVMNNQYQIVKVVNVGGGADMHEFNLVDGGTKALVTSYVPQRYRSPVNGHKNIMEWVEDGIFKEVDVATGRVNFEWHALDHVIPGNVTNFGTEVANTTTVYGFDYFHINSVDKNPDGDYLVGSRNTDSVYKISGVDGHVMWRLTDGPGSTFRLNNFRFSAQHHVRWVSENATHTIISMFDNGFNGATQSSPYSSGMKVLISHSSKTATLLRKYNASGKGIQSVSQGSMQALPNYNVFVSWGASPVVTEHLEDGTAIFEASMNTVGSYRAFKSVWTGLPISSPDLWTYARNESSQTVLYVSWNGATEAESWNFYTSTSRTGPFDLAGSSKKNGFETTFIVPDFHHWTVAEAVAKNGSSLSNSSIVHTWSPGPVLALHCSDVDCPYEDTREPTEVTSAPNSAGVCGAGTNGLEERPGKSFMLSSWFGQLFIVISVLAILCTVATWVRNTSFES